MAEAARSQPGVASGICTAAALVLTFLAASSSGLADTLPEPLEKSICYDPDIHDRVTGHLLYSHMVTQTGRVTGVRAIYARVEPEELKNRLVGALRMCMETWKFKPGTRGGSPADILMMTPFHFFKPAPPNDPQVSIPGGGTIGQSRLDEMREEKLRLVNQLLSGRLYVEERGPGWVLKTDVGRKDADAIREALLFASRAFDKTFPGLPPVQDPHYLTVVVFRDAAEYGQVAAFDNLIPVQNLPTGRYHPRDRVIYTAKDTKPTSVVTDVMAHEMVHHLISYRLYANREDPPFWIREGIAAFFELLKKDKGDVIDLAALERGRVPAGAFVYLRNADRYLSALRDAEKRGKLPPLPDLLQPQCPTSDLYLAQSWLLVHYLINAEEGRYRAAFEAWLRDPGSEGNGESLARAIGRSLDQLQAALPPYTRSLS